MAVIVRARSISDSVGRPGMRLEEHHQGAEAIVGAVLFVRAAFEPRERFDGQLALAGGQLRLPQFEHQRQLDAAAFVVWQVGGVRQRAVQERRRLARRVPLQAVGGRQPEVAGRAPVVAGAMEVPGRDPRRRRTRAR